MGKGQERLRAQARQWLEPGEQLQAVFTTQTGPTGIGTWGPGSLLQRYWIVVVTDRNLLIGPLGVKGAVKRLPRVPFEMPDAPARASWFPVTIAGQHHRSAREQFAVVAAAHAALSADQGAIPAPAAGGPAPLAPSRPQPQPGWYADPTSRHQVRYWDGREWTSNVADQGVQATDPVNAA